MKRILQEASVIGRAFLYEILNKVSELKDRLDQPLRRLEESDLIRVRSFQPELEYIFKHALTQEVVYSGLLKRERMAVHERIALVMEQLFHGRLSEFYETLAFHFKRGQSQHKAVDYLMKSGEKSLKRYAVEESHQYYQEAFDLLANKTSVTEEERRLLIDLLIKWAYVFYYRGDFRGLVRLFSDHERLAESLDKAELGMFYAWLGLGLNGTGEVKSSYEYLCKALKIGEGIEDQEGHRLRLYLAYLDLCRIGPSAGSRCLWKEGPGCLQVFRVRFLLVFQVPQRTRVRILAERRDPKDP